MRARTYGRKKGAISKADMAFILDSSSPEKAPESSIQAVVLIEKSQNIPSKAATISIKATSTKAQSEDIASPAQTPQRRSKARVDQYNLPGSIHSAECHAKQHIRAEQPIDASDDLAAALGGLSIHATPIKLRESIAESSIIQPQIPQRPAKVSTETFDYLSPLLRCKNVSQCVENFQGWADERAALLDISKVGEGSFGEVYRAGGPEGADTVILKLMPLNAKKGKGSRSYTSVSSAANEVHLLNRMQRVPGFVEFRGACILQGPMASQFTGFWNEYRDSGRTVESKDPNIKATYPNSQFWLLIEMSDAGKNLEHGQYLPPGRPKPAKGEPYLCIHSTWDIFWQIVKAIGKAEAYCQFEHRDLHLGNVCVKDLYPEADIEIMQNAVYSSKRPLAINKSGTSITLIDYSLSRAAFSDGKEFFYDFQHDKGLLNGEGDLQYDMYRYMAQAVGDESCKDYHPRTNIVWLYYVLRMLLKVTLKPARTAKTSVGKKMFKILKDLEVLIDPENMAQWGIDNAGDLLDVGLESRWFLPGDVLEE